MNPPCDIGYKNNWYIIQVVIVAQIGERRK